MPKVRILTEFTKDNLHTVFLSVSVIVMGHNLLNLQVRSVRLVNDEGIIRPETFYKYLMVWYNVDYMGYTMSQVCNNFNMF